MSKSVLTTDREPRTTDDSDSVEIEESAAEIVVRGDDYTLRVSAQEALADLELNGRRIATLNLASGVDVPGQADEDTRLGPAVIEREPGGEVVLTWRGSSALWPGKTVELRASRAGFSYGYSVEGEGEIERAYMLRTRSKASAAQEVRLFNPEPNSGCVHYTGGRCPPGKLCYMCYPEQLPEETSYSGPEDYMTVSVGRDRYYHDGNWFFTPAPFCFAVEGEGNWLAIGIAAEPGEWMFTDMEYPGGGFGFSLVYDGHVRVSGSWRSPRLVCLTASDEFDAVERYCHLLRERGLVPTHGRGPVRRWWLEPIYCGWGEQVSQEVHAASPGLAADRATQANYERWLGTLEAHGINPGTVVIDDKWQRHYGLNDVDAAKWPDMPAFIARQHRKGRYVLLWLNAWTGQGLPPEECIVEADGSLRVDPGNPAFRTRLAEEVRHMLQDLDADGFKIDFTHLIPRGPGLRSHAGLWGLELMRQWLQIVSDVARQAKPDALLIAHTANPYLADLVDMLRLNDVAGLLDIEASIVPDMRRRARLARAASPYWLLDSDNWPCASRAQWRDYIRTQATGELGVPSLYHAERFGWGAVDEPLEEEDYEAVRASWAAYRAALGERQVVQTLR